MTAIHVEVTAEQIAAAGDDRMAWAQPVEDALAALTGVGVSVDGDDDSYLVTIGTQEVVTFIADLPADAKAWLDRRWHQTDATTTEPVPGIEDHGEPFAFDIEVPTWLTDLIRVAG